MFGWFRKSDPLEPQRSAIRQGQLPTVPAGWKAWRNAVAGEAQRNSDGVSRQDIIAGLKVGESVVLQPEPENRYDRHAVRVMSRRGQIGYLPRDHGLNVEVEEGRIHGFIGALKTGGANKIGVVLVLVRGPKTRAKKAAAEPSHSG